MTCITKFPSEIVKIAGYDIQLIIWSDHEAIAAHRYAEFSSIEQVIRIQKSFASPSKLVDTFLHEMMHAIFWAYGVGKDDNEERMVTMFGTALMTLHRDNPWIADWITKTLRFR